MLFETSVPPRRTLRGLLRQQDLISAVGAWDGASAAIAESVGMDAVFTGGWMIAASAGLPDAEMYSKAHSLEAIRTVASRTTAAVISDMDGGFGGAAQVFHSLQAFERAGASAVMLEDQKSPKLACNWLASGREVYDEDFASAKVRAAVQARRDPETIVIARTDAEGEEIYRRGVAYADAGAEMLCAISTSEEFGPECWKKLHEETGLPLVLAPVPGTWQEREFTPQVAREVGIALLALGLPPFNAAMAAIRRAYEQIRDGVPLPEMAKTAMSTEEFAGIIGLSDAVALEARFTQEIAAT